MTEEIAPAVVYIFMDQDRNVYLEQRPANSSYPEEWIFPGGKVEVTDIDRITSLAREIQEETNVKPLTFHPLELPEMIYSPRGRKIYPFIITKWEGQLPPYILDNGHPTKWFPIEEAINSPVKSVRKLAIIINQSLKI
ncbi:MAG: NUDIX domain-containing protein [Candidatus Daviesbacteria bacterium]